MLKLTRTDAGRRLAAGLGAVVTDTPVVIALSTGGARVASEIAHDLDAPLDVIGVVRLEVPGRTHGTFGAVADGAALVEAELVRALDLPADYVEGLVAQAHREVDRLTRAWRAGASPVSIKGRTVILADDGLSEAVAVTAAARALLAAGAARVVLAAPFATAELLGRLTALGVEPLVLFPANAPAPALICDPTFEQTTPTEVGSMVRHSRPGFPANQGS